MDASTLSYTTNETNTGYVLSSSIGKIHYTNNEFIYYKLLFEIIDIDDDGRISFKDCSFLIGRSKIPRVSSPPLSHCSLLLIVVSFLSLSLSQKTVFRAWGTISKNKNDDIVLEQWVILLKIMSYIQSHNNETTDLERMLQSSSILQLNLLSSVSPVDISTKRSASSLDIDIIGWKDVGEGLQKHVVYSIRYITSLLHFSKLEWEVTRRYSDFQFLSDRLTRYEGSLIPPLPPKQIINSLFQDLPMQRSQELSLFL